jgi:hypothetical protein
MIRIKRIDEEGLEIRNKTIIKIKMNKIWR